MIDRKIQKNYFSTFSDFCLYNNLEENYENLYSYLKLSVIIKVNPFIFSKIEIIKDIDNSIESEDILTDCFMYFYNKDCFNIGIKEIKNFLSNYKAKVNRLKRKCNKDNEFSVDDFSSNSIDLDTNIFVKSLLEKLSSQDREYIELYFFSNYTYEQITEIMPIKTKRGVKKRIDAILKKLRDTL